MPVATISMSWPPQRTDEALAPIENRSPGTVSLCLLGRVGLGLMLAGLAPHNQPDVRGSRISERHRRAGIGFQRGERRLCFAVARGGAYGFGGGGNGSRTGS